MAKNKAASTAPAAAQAAPTPPSSPKKVTVKAPKPQLDPKKLQVSSPESDFNHKVVKLGAFLPRAGIKSYADELKERLQDVASEPAKSVYYLLPVKLPKKAYKRLLEASLEVAAANPEWTERDHLEALVNLLDAGALTSSEDKA